MKSNRVMKNNIYVRLFMAYSLMQFMVPNLHADMSDNEKMCVGAVVMCAVSATVWAVIEKIANNKLNTQVTALEHEQKEEEKDKRVLVAAKEFITQEQAMMQDIKTIADEGSITKLASLEKLIYYFTTQPIPSHIASQNIASYESYQKYLYEISHIISRLHTQAVEIEQELETRYAVWINHIDNYENVELYKQHVKAYAGLKDELSKQRTLLAYIKSFIAEHRSGLELHVVLRTADTILWQAENNLVRKNSSSEKKEQELLSFSRCAAADKDEAFPLVRYALQREKEKKVYERLIRSTKLLVNKLDGSLLYTTLLQQAEERYSVISELLNMLSQSITYQRELSAKYEFELRKEKQEAEIKFTKERMQHEKIQIQTVLQQEENKAQKIANKKEQLKNERLKYQAQQRQMKLELERIRNGKIVEEAVSYNDKKWFKQIEQIKKEKRQLLKERDHLKAQLSKNETHQKMEGVDKFKQERKIKELENKIAKCNQLFIRLHAAISLPKPDMNDISVKAHDLRVALAGRW